MEAESSVKVKTNKIVRTGRKVKLQPIVPDDVNDIPNVYQPFNIVDDQNRAYYESLEKDMEKEFQEQLAQIQRLELEEMEEKKRIQLAKIEELAKIEKEKNQPSQEEMRQRRLKFYENK
jgi:uncharacterized protein YfbU (UPF0304 family)